MQSASRTPTLTTALLPDSFITPAPRNKPESFLQKILRIALTALAVLVVSLTVGAATGGTLGLLASSVFMMPIAAPSLGYYGLVAVSLAVATATASLLCYYKCRTPASLQPPEIETPLSPRPTPPTSPTASAPPSREEKIKQLVDEFDKKVIRVKGVYSKETAQAILCELVELNAPPGTLDAQKVKELLHWAAILHYDEEIVAPIFMLTDLQAEDDNGDTMLLWLHKAALLNKALPMQLLLELKADVNHTNKNGERAIHIALSAAEDTLPHFTQTLRFQHLICLKALVSNKNIDLNVPFPNVTPPIPEEADANNQMRRKFIHQDWLPLNLALCLLQEGRVDSMLIEMMLDNGAKVDHNTLSHAPSSGPLRERLEKLAQPKELST